MALAWWLLSLERYMIHTVLRPDTTLLLILLLLLLLLLPLLLLLRKYDWSHIEDSTETLVSAWLFNTAFKYNFLSNFSHEGSHKPQKYKQKCFHKTVRVMTNTDFNFLKKPLWWNNCNVNKKQKQAGSLSELKKTSVMLCNLPTEMLTGNVRDFHRYFVF